MEDTNEYLNKPIQVQVFDIDKEKGRLILSAKEILREKAEEERKTKISNVQVGLVTEGVVERLTAIWCIRRSGKWSVRSGSYFTDL